MAYMTASDLTKMMIDYLKARGNDVWRNNNLAVKGRSFIGRKGVSDIIGYSKKYGQFIGVEIKALGDRLSPDQMSFLTNLGMSGGIAMICSQDREETIILEIFKQDGENKKLIWNELEKEFR